MSQVAVHATARPPMITRPMSVMLHPYPSQPLTLLLSMSKYDALGSSTAFSSDSVVFINPSHPRGISLCLRLSSVSQRPACSLFPPIHRVHTIQHIQHIQFFCPLRGRSPMAPCIPLLLCSPSTPLPTIPKSPILSLVQTLPSQPTSFPCFSALHSTHHHPS